MDVARPRCMKSAKAIAVCTVFWMDCSTNIQSVQRYSVMCSITERKRHMTQWNRKRCEFLRFRGRAPKQKNQNKKIIYFHANQRWCVQCLVFDLASFVDFARWSLVISSFDVRIILCVRCELDSVGRVRLSAAECGTYRECDAPRIRCIIKIVCSQF